MIDIDSERIKELAKKRGMTQTYLANEIIHVSYEHFSRQLKSGKIQKYWLEKLCDALNASRKYLTGEYQSTSNRNRIPARSNDYYVEENQRKAIAELLLYSRHESYSKRVDELTLLEIQTIIHTITWLMDDPETYYKTFYSAN